MMDDSFQRELIHEVEQLSTLLQRKVLEYAKSLKVPPKATAGRGLREFAGIMSPEEAKNFSQSIEEDCEKIDPSGW